MKSVILVVLAGFLGVGINATLGTSILIASAVGILIGATGMWLKYEFPKHFDLNGSYVPRKDEDVEGEFKAPF